jgi:hypothetical protein
VFEDIVMMDDFIYGEPQPLTLKTSVAAAEAIQP